MARSSWRQARNIRRLTNLSIVEMAAMDPAWAAYEDGQADLTPALPSGTSSAIGRTLVWLIELTPGGE